MMTKSPRTVWWFDSLTPQHGRLEWRYCSSGFWRSPRDIMRCRHRVAGKANRTRMCNNQARFGRRLVETANAWDINYFRCTQHYQIDFPYTPAATDPQTFTVQHT